MEFRLPTSVVPSRYDLRLEPDLDAATFRGEEVIDGHGRDTHDRNRPERRRARDRVGRRRARRRRGSQGSVVLQAEEERARFLFPSAIEPGSWRLKLALHRRAQRPPARLLPKHVQGRRGCIAYHRGHAVRVDRCPARLPVLGRAGVQGRVRRHAGRPRRPGRRVECRRHRRDTRRDRQEDRHVRRHDPDVDLPGGVRRGRAGGDRSRDGGPDATARVVRAVQEAPGALCQRVGAFSLEFFERYYGLPYPGDKLDMLAIPDFAAGAMENLGAITYRKPRSWWTRRRPHTWSCNGWPTWSRTRSPTCGSAIS